MRSPVPFAALAILLWACARPGAPPGGSEDRRPPYVIGTEPDTFSVVPPFRKPVLIRFSERISERVAGGRLEDAVVVSPRTGEVRVAHRRQGLAVEVVGGFREGLVYRITVLPRLQDMFGNTMRRPFELVFSTGPELPRGVLAGLVTDRITGRPVAEASVDAVAPGGLVYAAPTDTAGIFAMRFMPEGEYRVLAYLDRNRNRELDGFEARDTALVRLGAVDTALLMLAVLEPDTTPAVLARVEAVDSGTLRLLFDDYLAPEDSLHEVAVRLIPVDTTGVAAAEPVPVVRQLVHRFRYEAMKRAATAASRAAERLGPGMADTAGASVARGPGLQVDTTHGAPQRGELRRAPGAEPDTAGAGEEVALPARELVALLDPPLAPGVLYRVEVSGLRNINGVSGGGGRAMLQAPERPPGDTTPTPRDRAPLEGGTGVAPEAAPSVPDTGQGPVGAPGRQPGSAGAVRDTTGARRPQRGAPPPGRSRRSSRDAFLAGGLLARAATRGLQGFHTPICSGLGADKPSLSGTGGSGLAGARRSARRLGRCRRRR